MAPLNASLRDDEGLSAYALACILNDVWRELVNERNPRVLDKSLTRPQMARRIKERARRGECNVQRLKEEAKASAQP